MKADEFDPVPPAVRSSRSRFRARLARAWTTAGLKSKRVAGPALHRGFDAFLAGAGLLAATPVIACAACAVKVTSPGPVFFKQVRVGEKGQPLTIYKLRTMYVDAEKRLADVKHLNESQGGVTFKIRRDPRITPVGRVLRKLSIDELPQLWNVLNGTMTTFGPRPPLPKEVALYGPLERRRLEVKPGLTCLWQVSGRSDLSFEQQVALDIEFIDTSTVKDEIEIFARTIPAVVTGKGAY
jgi:lipopolysaccharide/colanic/teichoic acid biosynthesis glycosyltransferase